MEEHVKLGDLVKDPITGFTGIMTSRTEFIFGCVRCCITGLVLDKDGKEQNLHFDVAQLELLEAGRIKKLEERNQLRPPGGPARTSSPPRVGSSR